MGTFETDPKRQATASFRGYRYQAFQSVSAWMRLSPQQVLILEGAEDFDLREPDDSRVTTTQVKDLSGNLTLRSNSVIEAINNYWSHRKRNPSFHITFRFLTTANPGQEQGNPFGENVKGLDYWERLRADDKLDISPLKNFLLNQTLDPELKKFIAENDETTFRTEIIEAIRWDLSVKSSEALLADVQSNLIIHGNAQPDPISPHYSAHALLDLLNEVEKRMSSDGDRSLRYSDFLSTFETATSEAVSRGQLARLRADSSALQLYRQQYVYGGEPKLLEPPIPLVQGAIGRDKIVQEFSSLLRSKRALFLQGSSGLGKTTLARLITEQFSSGTWLWAEFRAQEPDRVASLLTRVRNEIGIPRSPVQIVLDDLDLTGLRKFERELIALLFSVINSDGLIIVTGPVECPAQLFPKAWLEPECQARVPYFTDDEIADLIQAHGLAEIPSVRRWAQLVQLTTSGHPQLVHARVRNLSSQSWPVPSVEDFTKPKDVEHIRLDARNSLRQETPSEQARTLMFRLSLTSKSFTRDLAISVASVNQKISLPGEAFDALVGPWIEREQTDRYRISPLLAGAGNDVLPPGEITAVHETISVSILLKKPLNQYDFGTAFAHALSARSGGILAQLAVQISGTSNKDIGHLADALFWLPAMALEPGQKIFKEHAITDFFLRLAQYKIAAFGPEPASAVPIIPRVLEALREIKDSTIRPANEALAYGSILYAINVPIPSSTVVSLVSSYLDVNMGDETLPELAEIFQDASEPEFAGLSKPQVLFSFQASRIAGLDDLEDLLNSLNALDESKRRIMLAVCDSDLDFSALIINGAWWKDTQRGDLDVDKAISVLTKAIRMGREWGVPKITREAYVAVSVVWDEYGKSYDRALAALNEASSEFADDTHLKNQRAKLLYHADRYQESLHLSEEFLDDPGDLSNVEILFTFRASAICAAKLNDWQKASDLFLRGAKSSKRTDILPLMGIGLKADAALAMWRCHKEHESLRLFAEVLTELKEHPISENLQCRHLHATVRHTIAWIQKNMAGHSSAEITDPYPGMCSNQSPSEGIRDFDITSLPLAWGLLAGTERFLGIDIGVGRTADEMLGTSTPPMILINNESLAFDGVWHRNDLERLVPAIIRFTQVMRTATRIRQEGRGDEVSLEFSPLPDDYWNSPDHRKLPIHFLLAAAIVLTQRTSEKPLPVGIWKEDLADSGALIGDIADIIRIFEGAVEIDKSDLNSQAALSITKLRGDTIAPSELFICYFMLLNAMSLITTWAASDLEMLASRQWTKVADTQQFAFLNPRIYCQCIKDVCADQTLSGYAKVAAILEVAAPALRMNLASTAWDMLHTIKANGQLPPVGFPPA